MDIHPLKLPGTFEITLAPNRDDRGYFMRVYDEDIYAEYGLSTAWVQENQSLSFHKGTVRGLHYQKPPHAETKLVRAVAGEIYDVFVDLRTESSTFGQWDAVVLSAEKLNMVYIPKGFAHGFCSLVDNSVVGYRVDSAYAPNSEGGLLWNDPELAIEWPEVSPHISKKDAALPGMENFDSPF